MFVAPELSEVRQVAVHHFPVAPIPANVEFDFIIAKNGAHGNVAVKVRLICSGRAFASIYVQWVA